MLKIVAIGGGEIGGPGFAVETTKIDKEIIKLSGKKNPRLLFIPTASSDAEGYFDTVKKYFGTKLGCKVEVLYLIKEKLSLRRIEEKILNSDIIYVGGGNTLKLMNIWRKQGVDKILKKAIKRGVVLSGLSAGSICWFNYGNSDSRRFTSHSSSLIRVSGLGLIDALNCPHYDVEKSRRSSLKKMMKRTPGIAIAVDNCCALEVVDDKYKIISSKESGNAYKIYWKAGIFKQELVKKEKTFKPLKDLLVK